MDALLLTAFPAAALDILSFCRRKDHPVVCSGNYCVEDPAVVVAHRDEVSPNSQVDVMEFVAEGPT
jgi:hypothetical protein